MSEHAAGIGIKEGSDYSLSRIGEEFVRQVLGQTCSRAYWEVVDREYIHNFSDGHSDTTLTLALETLQREDRCIQGHGHQIPEGAGLACGWPAARNRGEAQAE